MNRAFVNTYAFLNWCMLRSLAFWRDSRLLRVLRSKCISIESLPLIALERILKVRVLRRLVARIAHMGRNIDRMIHVVRIFIRNSLCHLILQELESAIIGNILLDVVKTQIVVQKMGRQVLMHILGHELVFS